MKNRIEPLLRPARCAGRFRATRVSAHKPRWLAGLGALLLVLAACNGGDRATEIHRGSPGASSGQSEPSSADTAVTTSTTAAKATLPSDGLDLSQARWVTHGPDGIHLDDGTLIWETEPFPADVARDHQGGLAFTDSSGLWWFQAGTLEPALVREGVDRLFSVSTTSEGPVASVLEPDPGFYSLIDGNPVEAPPEAEEEPSSGPPWSWRWVAANGLSARVTDPVVEWDAEGQPSEILEPTALVISRGQEVLSEVQIGGPLEEWATIHDFDGQTLILSRGPDEPAMAEETFLIIDLASGEVTGSFIAGGTRATLTGADVDWDGAVQTPDLGGYTPGSITTDEGVGSLEDGRYLAFITGISEKGTELELDLAVWLSGNAANAAAAIDGKTEVPVPNDYYIRNLDPTIISMPARSDPSVTSVWFHYQTDRDLESDPITYQQFLEVFGSDEENTKGNLRTSPWWITVEEGEIVALDEQYVP